MNDVIPEHVRQKANEVRFSGKIVGGVESLQPTILRTSVLMRWLA